MNVYLKKKSEKTAYLGFRLTADEKQSIEIAAQNANEDVSDYIRKAIQMRMQSAPPPMRQSVMVYDEARLRNIVRDEINQWEQRQVQATRVYGGARTL